MFSAVLPTANIRQSDLADCKPSGPISQPKPFLFCRNGPSPRLHQGRPSSVARSTENVFHLHWCPSPAARRRDTTIVEHLGDGAQRGRAGLLCLPDERQHLVSTLISCSLVG